MIGVFKNWNSFFPSRDDQERPSCCVCVFFNVIILLTVVSFKTVHRWNCKICCRTFHFQGILFYLGSYSAYICTLSCSAMSDSLPLHGLQLSRPLCPRGFSRQEYWCGLPCPPPGDLPNPRIEPRSPALQEDSLFSEPPGKCLSINKLDANSAS